MNVLPVTVELYLTGKSLSLLMEHVPFTLMISWQNYILKLQSCVWQSAWTPPAAIPSHGMIQKHLHPMYVSYSVNHWKNVQELLSIHSLCLNVELIIYKIEKISLFVQTLTYFFISY